MIYAIPMYDDGDSTASDWVFYPPLLSSNPFRQCGPQPAFVIDNKDLTGQGRVRIRFPWQQSLSMEDSKITDYEDALEEAKDKQEDAEEALEPYAQDDSIKVNDVVVTATKLTSVAETVFEESRKKYEDAIKDYYKKKTGAAEQEMLEARRLFEAYVVLGSIEVKEHVAEAKKKSDVSETKYTEYFTAFQTAVTNRYEAERTLETAKAHRAIAEAGTPWIRMATPTATTGGGMFFKPETGDEVMVDFENGNIERPFVVGTLYSKNVRVPSGGRVIMSKNGHSIKMSDPTDGTLFLSGAYPGLKFLQSFSKDIKIDFLKFFLYLFHYYPYIIFEINSMVMVFVPYQKFFD